MNIYKQYLIILAFATSLSLVGVLSINYSIDPARIYHDISETGSNSEGAYAARLVNSTNGSLWSGSSWNGRDIKSLLAKNNKINAGCAVIGSSHVMQISSFRKNASLSQFCSSIINLGVAGGTLEDYLALSYMLINNAQKPNTIVFGIAPWALDFDKDVRSERYTKAYDSMKILLKSYGFAQNSKINSEIKYFINLINSDYFFRSIQTIRQERNLIKEAPAFNYLEGFEEAVHLPDGSIIYSKEFISNSNTSKIPIGGGTLYKINKDSPSSEIAINLFKKLVVLLNRVGINVVFLMTPYHHNVWEDKKSLTTQALLKVELRIKKLGNELGIKVIGSYSPYRIGCNTDEFYDFMHAKDSCLSKIVD
jgi:hypothetical protein